MSIQSWRRGVSLLALLTGALAFGAALAPSPAVAQSQDARAFDIPAQSLSGALLSFGRQSGLQLVAPSRLTEGRRASAVRGQLSPDAALDRLLAGSGLAWRRKGASIEIIPAPPVAAPAPAAASRPQPSTRPAASASSRVSDLLITARRADGYRAGVSATATRTATDLRDVPQSIQIVTREVLEDQQAVRLTDALQNVSSVQLNGTGGNRGETYQIRGFVTPRYAVNGFPLTSAMDRPEAFFDLANVERVEVLKGPSSVMFGLSEPGGVINVVTRAPSPTAAREIAVQGGSFGLRRVEATATGGLTQDGRLSARVTGAAQTSNGFRDNAADSDRIFAALAVNWRPDDATNIDFTVDHVDQSQPFDRGLIATPDGRVVKEAGRYLGEIWSTTEARKTVTGLSTQRALTQDLALRFTGRYSNARVHDDNAVDLQGVDADGRTVRRRVTDRTEDSHDLNLRLDLMANARTGLLDHRILAGVERTEAHMDFDSARANIGAIDLFAPVYGATPIPTTRPNSSYVYDVEMLGLFVQDQIALGERWKALVSLRHDAVKTNEDSSTTGVVTRTDDKALTFRAGLVHQPRPWASLYASYTESFQPQAGLTASGETMAPERGRQVEIGAKFDLLGGRLSLTTAAFEITKRNVATEDPSDPDFSILTGEQRVRGVELDATGVLAPGWRLIGNVAFLDAEITRDNTFAVGNRLNGVPEYSGRLWTSRDFGGRLKGLTVGGGLTFVGPRQVDLDNRFEIDGYTTLDATVRYAFSPRAEISVNVRNIADTFFVEGVQGDNNLYPGAPRAVSVLLRTRF